MADLESVANELYSNGNRVFVEGDSIDADTLDGFDSTKIMREVYILDGSSTLNLNDVLSYEGLLQRINGGALPEYNYPEPLAGQMLTWGALTNESNRTQLYATYDNSNLWIRNYYTIDGWSSWKSVTFNAIGEIKQYTGKVVDIPKGWNIANGNKGTVDMSVDFKTYGTDEVVYIQYTGGN